MIEYKLKSTSHWYSVEYRSWMTSYGVIFAVSSCTSMLRLTWNVDGFVYSMRPWPLRCRDLELLSFGTPARTFNSSSVGCKYRTKPVEHSSHLAREKYGLNFWMMLTITRVRTSCAPSRAWKKSKIYSSNQALSAVFIFIFQLYWDELVCGDVLRKCVFLKLAFIRKIKFEIIRSHHHFLGISYFRPKRSPFAVFLMKTIACF